MPYRESETKRRRHARRHVLTALLTSLVAPAASKLANAENHEFDVAHAIVGAFDGLFAGPNAGMRAVHANGLLCEGYFVPARDALRVSRAPHFTAPRTPVLVRFSNFAAVRNLPDGHPAAAPRGMAIKFLLPDEAETDIVAHSYDGFPAATPEKFLRFLRTLPNADALAALAEEEPAVKRFLVHPKPAPMSYASENYFGVTAFTFSNAHHQRQAGRYRIVPTQGAAWLSAAEAGARHPDYLAKEMQERLEAGPAVFRLQVQLAGPGDRTDNGTQTWPEDRHLVELGTLSVQCLAMPGDSARRDLRFVPTSLVAGIEASDDPMLLSRTLAYDLSAERRSQQ